ncbi:MAG: mannose-6-phosphate isomerase, class I [Desulfococcus sp. 4484_242]|nr:MAG: mannose-6-phosphate isomerase, class I [Desulfococcus sp. 4484_242]
MDRIAILKNPVQEYAWGSRTYIQNLIGKPEGRPMAELWMGAHPRAPSSVRTDGKWQSLDRVISQDPEAVLGKHVAERFGGELPFLFKILAAEKPLSIQVHPDLAQAKLGFEKENRRNVPLDAPERNYRDANHKPEILCALTPFEGLKGFRDTEEILRLIDRLCLKGLRDECTLLRKHPDSHGLKSFFSAIMHMDNARREKITAEAAENAEKLAGEDPAFHWIAMLYTEYPGDIGILSPALLNLVMLQPEEAIYLPAGELHAYLRGLGIELMANSDNVLRGGLTPKHIDVSELLSIVVFRTGGVRKVPKITDDAGQTIYETPAEEFLLSSFSVRENSAFTSASDRNVEIMICLDGKAEIEDLGKDDVLCITRGQSVIIPARVSRYRIRGNATFYRASVPPDTRRRP